MQKYKAITISAYECVRQTLRFNAKRLSRCDRRAVLRSFHWLPSRCIKQKMNSASAKQKVKWRPKYISSAGLVVFISFFNGCEATENTIAYAHSHVWMKMLIAHPEFTDFDRDETIAIYCLSASACGRAVRCHAMFIGWSVHSHQLQHTRINHTILLRGCLELFGADANAFNLYLSISCFISSICFSFIYIHAVSSSIFSCHAMIRHIPNCVFVAASGPVSPYIRILTTCVMTCLHSN